MTKDIDIKDMLATERTRLANERTFLAYFRSSIVFISSGIAIVKISALSEIIGLGYFLIITAPVLFMIGVLRFIYVRKQIRKMYKADTISKYYQR